MTPSDPTGKIRTARTNDPSKRGSAPDRDFSRIRSAPKIPLDEARLRPHLRQVQPSPFIPGIDLSGPDVTPLGQITRTYVPDPTDLRGIPAIGRGVAGVQPGTDPYAATASKLDRRASAA